MSPSSSGFVSFSSSCSSRPRALSPDMAGGKEKCGGLRDHILTALAFQSHGQRRGRNGPHTLTPQRPGTAGNVSSRRGMPRPSIDAAALHPFPAPGKQLRDILEFFESKRRVALSEVDEVFREAQETQYAASWGRSSGRHPHAANSAAQTHRHHVQPERRRVPARVDRGFDQGVLQGPHPDAGSSLPRLIPLSAHSPLFARSCAWRRR